MVNHPNRSKTAKLLAEAKTTAQFLEHLAQHLEASEMSGQAGNCMIRVGLLRAAIARAEGKQS